jgi:hypothetical protein
MAERVRLVATACGVVSLAVDIALPPQRPEDDKVGRRVLSSDLGYRRRRPASDVKLGMQYIDSGTGQIEVRPARPDVQGDSPTTLHRRRLNQRGGLLLDAVLALAFILMAAYALESVGISFHQLTHAAMRFFGI